MNMNATAQMVTVSQGGRKHDQPKPVTHWKRPDNWHSKPTGEWTIRMVTDFIGRNVNHPDLVELVAAINAALAAKQRECDYLMDTIDHNAKESAAALAAAMGAMKSK